VEPLTPLGSPTASMLRKPAPAFNNPPALTQSHDPNSLLLFLHSRAALLGDYRISRATESLQSLRSYIVAHLDHFWCASFTFMYRDGVPIAPSHELTLLLRDLVKSDPGRSGVVIRPEHTSKTRRRHRKSIDRRQKKVEEKMARVADFESFAWFEEGQFGSGYGKDLQLPDVVDQEGGESADIAGAKRFSKEQEQEERTRDKVMGDYEVVKERIAVSYLANVELEREAARKELRIIMNTSALKIQSMYRCSKARSFIEDIMLRLQAAAVLQGIIRRNQSVAKTDIMRSQRDVAMSNLANLSKAAGNA